MHSNKSVNMCVNAAKKPHCSFSELFNNSITATSFLHIVHFSTERVCAIEVYVVAKSDTCIGKSRHTKTNSTPDHFYRHFTLLRYVSAYARACVCALKLYIYGVYVAFSFCILVQNIFQHFASIKREEVLLEIIA